MLRQVTHTDINIFIFFLDSSDDVSVRSSANSLADTIYGQAEHRSTGFIHLDLNLVLASSEAIGDVVDTIYTAQVTLNLSTDFT